MQGLSVIVRNEYEFNRMKAFLGHNILYVDWVEQMATVETAIVIWFMDNDIFSIGSVGSADSQREYYIETVEFSEFFK